MVSSLRFLETMMAAFSPTLPLIALAALAGTLLPGSAMAASSCPVISSGKWHAWIDRFPGKGINRLVVVGSVELPSPGYRWRMVKAGGLRGRPPLQELRLELDPPEGIVAQVVTPVDVRGEAKTAFSNLRVMVSCGGKRLAYFDEVVITD